MRKDHREIQELYQQEKVARLYEQTRFRSFIGKLGHELEITAINKALEAKKPSRLLEVATGTGRITRELKGFKSAIGIDSSPASSRRSSTTAAGDLNKVMRSSSDSQHRVLTPSSLSDSSDISSKTIGRKPMQRSDASSNREEYSSLTPAISDEASQDGLLTQLQAQWHAYEDFATQSMMSIIQRPNSSMNCAMRALRSSPSPPSSAVTHAGP